MAYPNELLIGPATAQRPYTIDIDAQFLTTLFSSGALAYFDAISVHFYRPNSPEDVVTEARELRALIDAYAPPGRSIPIVSGEWGYSTPTAMQPGWANVNETAQAQYTARAFLVNLALGINASIWYDWHDDYNDGSYEGSFGLVRNLYSNSSQQPYAPKPAFDAVGALGNFTAGCAYQGLISGNASGGCGGREWDASSVSTGVSARCYVSYWACPASGSPGMWPSFAAWCDAPQGWTAPIAWPVYFPGSCPWDFNVTGAASSSSAVAWEMGLGGQTRPRRPEPAAGGSACVSVRDYLGRFLGQRCPTGDPPAYSTSASGGITYLAAAIV